MRSHNNERQFLQIPIEKFLTDRHRVPFNNAVAFERLNDASFEHDGDVLVVSNHLQVYFQMHYVSTFMSKALECNKCRFTYN